MQRRVPDEARAARAALAPQTRVVRSESGKMAGEPATRTPPRPRRRSGSGQIGPISALAMESPAPRYAQVSAGSLSPAFNPLKTKPKKRVALVFEGQR